MATYEITAPNGKTYEITGPPNASREDLIRQIKAQEHRDSQLGGKDYQYESEDPGFWRSAGAGPAGCGQVRARASPGRGRWSGRGRRGPRTCGTGRTYAAGMSPGRRAPAGSPPVPGSGRGCTRIPAATWRGCP